MKTKFLHFTKNYFMLLIVLLSLLLGMSNSSLGQTKSLAAKAGIDQQNIGVQMAAVQSDKIPVENLAAETAVSSDESFENNQSDEPPTDAPLSARIASVSGAWSSTTTWGGLNVPTSADAVTINPGITLTVDVAAECASLTYATAANKNTIVTISGTNSLTFTGLLSMVRPTTNTYSCTMNVNAGSLNCGSLTMAATTTTRNDVINITTGTLTVTGTLSTGTGTTGCQFNITGAGTMNLGGTITATTPAIVLVAASTVNYTGDVAQTIIAATYGILSLSGAGTKTIAASKSVTATGNVTNSSTLVLTLGTSTTSTYLILGGNLANSGTINGTAAYTVVYFLGILAQTFTNNGTVTAPLYTLALGNSAGLTLLGSNPIICQRVNLYYGTVTNSNKITLGNGGATYGVVQIGANTTAAIGAFDQAPVFNAGTGGYQLLYAPALNDYSTSYEVPADGNIAYLLLVCTPKTLSLTRDITIPYVYTTGLSFTSGNLSIGAHTLTITGNTGIIAGTLTGGTSSNIIFNGITATALPAVSGGLNNLTINNAAGITLNGAVTVNGALALTNGLVNNGANLTMATGTTLTREAGSLTYAPSFSGTVNLTYSGSSPIIAGKELPTGSAVINNLTTNSGGITQYAANTSATNLLTDAFPDLTSWTGNIGTASMQFNANPSGLAGGVAPEGRFYSTEMTIQNITKYIYRGPLNTTGYNAINVSFKSYGAGNYTQSFPTYLKLQSATSTSGPWHDVWSMTYTSHAATTISVQNYTTDIGGNVYFQFAFVGDPYALDSWNFDNLVIDGVVIAPVASTATVNGTLDVTAGPYSIGNTNTLAIIGDLSGNSTLTGGTTSNLTIGGTGANFVMPAITNGLNNFTIDRPAGVSIPSTGALTVGGTLTNNAGTAGLTINSGGSLIQNSAGVAATVNRDITTGTSVWHLFMSPVTETIQTSVISCFNEAYIDRYNEPTGAWVRLITDQFVTPGIGYSIRYLTGTHTLDFPGTLKASPVTYSDLSYTASTPGYPGGYNLIGNPYTCALVPSLCSITGGLNAFAYVWAGANYNTLSIGNNDFPGTIAPMQGFFVRTSSGTNNLTLENAAKTHSGSFLKDAAVAQQMLKLSVDGNGYSDETYVRFVESATSGFDQALDAYKLFGI
ncbi:MAG: hypothetical protein WCM93_14630, partial [Bacteroidota bacterium]